VVDEVDSQGMLQNIMGPFRQQLRSLATRARREGKHRADRSVGRSVCSRVQRTSRVSSSCDVRLEVILNFSKSS